MKIQVRQNVFETNSSTQHTLCIKKSNGDFLNALKKVNEIGKGFTVPSNDTISWYEQFSYKDVVGLSDLSLVERLDILVASTLANYDRDSFLESLSMIQKFLSDIGMEMNVDFEKLYNLQNGYYWDDGLYASVNDMISSENIYDFLFSEDCVHTSFCDECCGEPSESVESVWERFDNMPKDGKIVLRERR